MFIVVALNEDSFHWKSNPGALSIPTDIFVVVILFTFVFT